MRAWLALTRPFTLLAPSVGTLTGAVAAAGSFDVPGWALAVGAAILATAASNAWNQVFDVEVDRENKPRRPIPAGRISPRHALVGGLVFAVLALALAALVSPWFLACVGVGVLSTWIYSAPPLRTKRSTLGALLTIAIPRGLLVPVAGWSVVEPPVTWDPWALGLVGGLYVFGAAATKDFSDVAGDRAHGCRTLPVLWGPERAARFVAPFLVFPFLLLPVLGLRAPMVLLTAVLVVAGAFTAWALIQSPRGRAAWVGMYLTLLLYLVGFAFAYLRAA